MMATTIKLITQTGAKNQYGAFVYTDTEKVVFAEVSSVSASEFFEGGRAGLNPAYRFSVISGDYSGEKIIEYDNKRYSVYRTYESNDHTELYVELRAGA